MVQAGWEAIPLYKSKYSKLGKLDEQLTVCIFELPQQLSYHDMCHMTEQSKPKNMNAFCAASVSAPDMMDPVGPGTKVCTAFVSVGVSLPPPGGAATTLKSRANSQVW